MHSVFFLITGQCGQVLHTETDPVLNLHVWRCRSVRRSESWWTGSSQTAAASWTPRHIPVFSLFSAHTEVNWVSPDRRSELQTSLNVRESESSRPLNLQLQTETASWWLHVSDVNARQKTQKEVLKGSSRSYIIYFLSLFIYFNLFIYFIYLLLYTISLYYTFYNIFSYYFYLIHLFLFLYIYFLSFFFLIHAFILIYRYIHFNYFIYLLYYFMYLFIFNYRYYYYFVFIYFILLNKIVIILFAMF